jgi:ribose transport system permease protein
LVEQTQPRASEQSEPGSVTSGEGSGGPPASVGVRIRRALAFPNISALYIFGALVILFALWVPSTFLTTGTLRSLLSDQAITALVAVGLVVPIAAGVVDLAIGTEVGLGAIIVAWLLADRHLSMPVAILLTLAAGAAVGAGIWALITRARINAFIATLGLSSVLLAVIAWISGSQQILNLPTGFGTLATAQLLGVTSPVYIMLVIAVLVWYVLEKTPTGRRVYATGANPEAATLAGVRTSRVILACTITCGMISALAGLLVSSQLSTGDPTIGPPYLLPAFAAVFLGSTQFRGGRPNVWGTVVAAYVLATGVKGFQLAGAPIWIPDLFNGAALLLAVGMAQLQKSPTARTAAIRRLIRGARQAPATPERLSATQGDSSHE